jgi:predicted O-methyltransferase YrrM
VSSRTLTMTEPLYDYILRTSLREPPLLKRLREETAKLPGAEMQISPEQGQFMAFLVETIGARRILEVGTFTGYSALWMALALPADGRIIACDINPETTAVARRYWAEGGVDGKIDLRLAPATGTLDALLNDGQAGRLDFMFIDADKTGYDAYYERGLKLLRPGGLMAIDNVLWSGAVADPKDNTDDTRAIRALNEKVRGDERVTWSLLPIGDGLSLVRRRA